MDHSPPGSSVHGILQVKILEWVAMPSSQGSSRPRDQTLVFCIAGRFFTAEPPGKPPHTVCESESRSVMSDSLWPHGLYIQSVEFSRPECWSGSLSLLQGIFPTQGSNPGLQHCRQILYHWAICINCICVISHIKYMLKNFQQNSELLSICRILSSFLATSFLSLTIVV